VAEGRRYDRGGIVALARIVDQHESAVAADLVRAGLRLRDAGTPGFTLDDLRDFVKHSPRESALYRAQYPETADWDTPALLLARLVDAGNWLVWSKTKDGAKGRNQPKPVPRPGVESPDKRRGGRTTTRLDKARARYAVPRK